MSFESKYSDNAVYLCFERRLGDNKNVMYEIGPDFMHNAYFIFSTYDYKHHLRKYQIDEYDIHSASNRPYDRPIEFYES